jgi:hypothetical protein
MAGLDLICIHSSSWLNLYQPLAQTSEHILIKVMTFVCDFYLSHYMMASIRILTCSYAFVNPAAIPLIRGLKEKIACLLLYLSLPDLYLSLPDSIGQSRRECWNSIDQPPSPPILGDFLSLGDTPRPPPEGNPSGLPLPPSHPKRYLRGETARSADTAN